MIKNKQVTCTEKEEFTADVSDLIIINQLWSELTFNKQGNHCI